MAKRRDRTQIVIKLIETVALVSPILFVFIVGILGFITPEYNHLSYTISRLAITRFGIVQQMNFLQLALGLLAAGYVVGDAIRTRESRHIIHATFIFSAIIVLILTLFRTAPFENTSRITFTMPIHAIVHFSALGIFFLIAPFGVRLLYRTFQNEPNTRIIAKFTLVVGSLVCLLSTLFLFIFSLRLFNGYYGIIQKGIILLCIYWLITVVSSVRK